MILEITAVPYNEYHFGGGETYPWRLFQGLSKKTDVEFYVSSQDNENVSLNNLHRVSAHFVKAPPFLNEHNPIPSLAGLRQIKQALLDDEVEFIHVHNLRTLSSTLWLLMSKLNKIGKYKVILSDHGSRVFPFPSLMVRSVDYYAAVSNFSGKILNSYCRKPTFIIPPIIPNELFEKRSKEEKDIDLIMYGRIAPWKRQDIGIRVVEKLVSRGMKDIKVVIAGGSLDKQYLSRLRLMVRMKNLEKNIDFMTDLSKAVVVNTLSRSKLSLLLSWHSDLYGKKYKLPELSSATILEAAALGIPSIASKINAFGEVIRDGETGILINPTRTDEVTDLIYKLLSNEEQINLMGDKARYECKTNNSEENVVNKFLRCIIQIRNGVL